MSLSKEICVNESIVRSTQHKIKEELRFNLREIKWRLIFVVKLLYNTVKRKAMRNHRQNMNESETGWDNYWDKSLIFDPEYAYNYVINGKPITPKISGFEFQKLYLIPFIAEKIKQFNCKKVLDIGSGSGLNLLLLAAEFPEVEFVGVEPTASGVRVSEEAASIMPPSLRRRGLPVRLENVKFIQGDILDTSLIEKLKDQEFDLVLTVGVLVVLTNYLDTALTHLFSINFKHFIFYEEWLDINIQCNRYWHLLKNDYFRASWEIFNRYPCELDEVNVPIAQPSGSRFAYVCGKKD